MAAHTAIAKYAGLQGAIIAALRSGLPITDSKYEALRSFTLHMLDKRGWADPANVDALMQAGYTQTTVLDIILAIGMKTLSNYTNHIAATPLDSAFEQFAWEHP
jgi:alkylhydroperoxidase family enzyme